MCLAAAAAMALACVGLWTRSYWLDEIESLFWAVQPWADFREALVGREISGPPLYLLFLRVWARAGTDEAWMRLPSVAAGVAACAYLARLAGRGALPMASRWAALFLMTSVFWVRHAQEARAYALVMFVGLVVWVDFWRILEKERFRGWLRYALCNLLLVHLHFLGLYFLLAQILVFAAWRFTNAPGIRSAGRAQGVALSLGLAAASLAPYAHLVGRLFDSSQTFYRVEPPLPLLVGFLFLKKWTVPWQEGWAGPLTAAVVAASDLVAALWIVRGLRRLWTSSPRFAGYVVLTLLSILPLLAWISRKGWMFESRMVVYLLPAMALVMAVGIARGRKTDVGAPRAWARFGRAFEAGLIVLFVTGQLVALGRYYLVPTDDWRGAAQWLAARWEPGDGVIFTGLTAYPMSYYLARSGRVGAEADVSLLPGPDREATCRYHVFSPEGHLEFMDRFVLPCGAPFLRRETRPILSSSDLEEELAGEGSRWLVVEGGMDGSPRWKGPWEGVLNDWLAQADEVRTFGVGEEVVVARFERRKKGLVVLPENGWRNAVALGPEGVFRSYIHVTRTGPYRLSLEHEHPWSLWEDVFRGTRYVDEERQTPIEVDWRLDELPWQNAELPQWEEGSGERVREIVLDVSVGFHRIELRASLGTAELLRKQQRSLPVDWIRLRWGGM